MPRSVRQTVYILLFAQLILIAAAGYIPDPFRVFAFTPTALIVADLAFLVLVRFVELWDRKDAQ